MKPKVFVNRDIPDEVAAYLAEHTECRRWPNTSSISDDQLRAELKDADGFFTSGTPINTELLKAAPRLKVVSNMSVGYDNFDIAAMKELNVMGTHTPDVLNDAVADLTFALMLAAARRVTELDSLVKQGGWQAGSDRPYFGRDVHHATLGIIGMGRIGRCVAERAKLGFRMEVLYHNRSRNPEYEQELGIWYRSLDELLQQSDFVVVLVPVNDQTVNLIDRRELELMKPDAFLIHVSRGKVVNEQALAEVLSAGGIAGAGLDVFEQEPVQPDNPLLKLSNVVTVPHIGSATAKTRAAMAKMAATNLVKALQGEIPPNLVKELQGHFS